MARSKKREQTIITNAYDNFKKKTDHMIETFIDPRVFKEGKSEGKKEGQREVAKRLLDEGFKVSEVAKFAGLAVEEIQKLHEVDPDTNIECERSDGYN